MARATIKGSLLRFEELSRNQRLVLATAETEGVVTHARMASICDLHPTDLTRMLQGLSQSGLLVQSGRTRATTYRLPEQPPADVGKRMELGGEGAELSEKGMESGGKGAELPEESMELSGKGAELGAALLRDGRPMPSTSAGHAQGAVPPIIAALEGLDAALTSALEAAAHPVCSRRWVRPEVVSQAIIEMCKGRYLTLAVLSTLLGRDDVYLRTRILAPMLKDGVLLRAFPDAPRDPRQAYTAGSERPVLARGP